MATTTKGINTNELFVSYQKEDVAKAQIIAKNIFCKDPSDIKVFNSYFSFCTGVITKKGIYSIETYQFFFSEAELALKIFSEKCEMDETALKTIDNCNEILQKKVAIINAMANDLQNKLELEAKSNNDQIFSDLCGKINQLQNYYTEKLVGEIASLDEQLDKDLLSKTQIRNYNTSSEKLSDIISKRLKKENADYNAKALKSFKEGIELFIDDSSFKKEKERDRLKNLLIDKLFSFSQEKLFPETLNYYNFVYSFIFGKLDNDGKLFMTECAINNKR